MKNKDLAGVRGSLVAIVTPMDEAGGLDLDAFRNLIDWHIAEGTDGIVVVGTTGDRSHGRGESQRPGLNSRRPDGGSTPPVAENRDCKPL